MRGGEVKHVTVHVHDIIGGDVLFTIEFNHYPDYNVEDVYTKLTNKIKTEFEDYHTPPGMVSGGANPPRPSKPEITLNPPNPNITLNPPNPPKPTPLEKVIKSKDKILADIEIFANNPSIMARGETYTLPEDGTTVEYQGLYENIPQFLKDNKNNKVIRDLNTAYLNALGKRVELRKQSQLLDLPTTQPKIPHLKINVKPNMGNNVPIEHRQIKKGTSKIYNTPGAIIIGENGHVKTDENGRIKDDFFTPQDFESKLEQPGPIQMTVYVK
jgi:hypothetical protein